MKRFFFVCLFAIFAIATQAQQDTVGYTKISDEINNVVNNLANNVTALAQAMKVPAEKVYGLLVKQQIVNSVVNCFVIVLLIFFVSTGWKMWTKGDNCTGIEEDKYYATAVVCGFCAAIALMYSVACLQETITGFINPEYGAIKTIMDFVK